MYLAMHSMDLPQDPPPIRVDGASAHAMPSTHVVQSFGKLNKVGSAVVAVSVVEVEGASSDERHSSNIIGTSVLINCIQFEKLPLTVEFMQSFRESVTSVVLLTMAPQVSGNCLSKSL